MNARRVVVIALWTVVGLIMIAGWSALARSGQMLQTGGGPPTFLTITALAAPALSTVMLRRRPDEWTGPLLGVCVVAALLGYARIGPVGVVAELGGFVALVTVLLPAVVALNYPAFGCPTPWLRRVTWCWWAAAAAGVIVGVSGATGGSIPGHWWYTEDQGPAGTAALVLLLGYSVLVLAGLTFTVIAAVSRYRSMPGGGRAVLRPMLLPLLCWAAATAAATGWTVQGSLTEPEVRVGPQPGTAFYTMLPTLLVAILAAGIWWIDTTVRRQPVRPVGRDKWAHRWRRYRRETAVEQYLSRALADPSIRVLYPVPGAANRGEQSWVDSQGRPATPDNAAPDRSATIIRRGDTVIGLIDQDAAASARPDAVELVATGAGLFMETERLTAAARSDLDRSRQLASRLLSASDEPRAELRAALLEGPLGDLTQVAADLETGVQLADVLPRLTAAAAQVRALSHGVFPPALTAGGLPAALPRTAVPDRRYPAAVEMTAYLAAHADPSAAITDTLLDGTPALRIRTALQPPDAVLDRVTALGGRIDATGAGWQLTVPANGGPT